MNWREWEGCYKLIIGDNRRDTWYMEWYREKIKKNIWGRRTEVDRGEFIKRVGTKESLESEGTSRNYLDEKAWPGYEMKHFALPPHTHRQWKIRHEMIYWMEGKKKWMFWMNEWMAIEWCGWWFGEFNNLMGRYQIWPPTYFFPLYN